MSHTPGPWVADIRGGCAGVKSVEPDDSPGMGCDYPSNLLLYTKRGCSTDGMYWSLPEETIANVKLAAAAPDLLKALQEIADHHEVRRARWSYEENADADQAGYHERRRDFAIEAIAKATGGEV